MRKLKDFCGPTQLARLALAEIDAGNRLIALCPEPDLPWLFAASGDEFLYHDYAAYRQDELRLMSDPTGSARLSWSPTPGEPAKPYDLAVIYLPKSTNLIEFSLASVAKVLELGTMVMVVGSNNSGIRSSGGLIEQYVGPVLSSRSARHSVLLQAEQRITPGSFEAERHYLVQIPGRQFKVVTLPGVFSHGQLDDGTRLLLDNIDDLDFRTALDWGCGSGVIGTALRLAYPETRVDFVDSNVMAIEATRRTLAANDLSLDGVEGSDIFSNVTEKYDLITANPPFHGGLHTDYAITESFISQAGRHLTRSGRLMVVANSFLNYVRVFGRYFNDVRILADNNRYRVIQARHGGG